MTVIKFDVAGQDFKDADEVFVEEHKLVASHTKPDGSIETIVSDILSLRITAETISAGHLLGYALAHKIPITVKEMPNTLTAIYYDVTLFKVDERNIYWGTVITKRKGL